MMLLHYANMNVISTSTALLYLLLDPTLAQFGPYKDPQKKIEDGWLLLKN